MPGAGYLVYDAGTYKNKGREAMRGITELIPESESIDLLVLSHSDADHIAAVEDILSRYEVKRVLRTGFARSSMSWRRANAAILRRSERMGSDFDDLNLAERPLDHGTKFSIGQAEITFVSGYHIPPSSWHSSLLSKRNAGSIVLRVTYAGKSILLTGDAIGRHIGDAPGACIATERSMVDQSARIPIASDILIAPNHGSDTASSTTFIEAVNPSFVAFSAGHAFQHPRKGVAYRYLDHGIGSGNIFRTDLGDDEQGEEWDYGRIDGHRDPVGDDDIDIVIHADGSLIAQYRRG